MIRTGKQNWVLDSFGMHIKYLHIISLSYFSWNN